MLLRTLSAGFGLLASLSCYAQSSTLPFKRITQTNDLNEGLSYEGDFKTAFSWQDKNGFNTFIVSQTPITSRKQIDNPDMEVQSCSLFIYHYEILEGMDIHLVRKVQDFVVDCPLDLSLNFVEESFTLTDLDRDQVAEASFVYRLACRGDVSGAGQKLMILENGDKYPVRGTCGLRVTDEEGKVIVIEKSAYTLGDEFKQAPKAFRQHAQALWKKWEIEPLGN